MTEHKKVKIKRVIFPVGIFLLMFTAQSVIGSAGVISYFFYSGKKNITEIENYTLNYSKTMAEAFARVAEFSYTTKKYNSLKTLFHEKIEENTIDEAFFVLNDGRLIVHSSTTAEKELMWNIANDEMAYNIDMILLPVQTKSSDLLLKNYNIVNKTVPFKRDERDLLRKYVYNDINSTGWLFTKGIFPRGKPAGTVNFIISKDRIYSSIQNSMDQAKYYTFLVITVSIFISFIVSLIVLFRYRSIQKNAMNSAEYGYATFAAGTASYSMKSADRSEDEDEVMFFPPDSNFIEPTMDFIVEDDFDDNVVEEDGTVVSAMNMHLGSRTNKITPLRKHDIDSEEDEYITVELLGEIESEPEERISEAMPETVKEYIAPVINLKDYKKSINKEIRDAIPIRKKR
jgi:hypothetical protein